MQKKIINTSKAPAPIGPYNQAVSAAGFVYVSGQICIDPENGAIINESLEAETHQVLNNLKAVLNAAGCELDDVLKTSIFLSDMRLFQEVNEIYAKYFPSDNAPARECVAVKALPKNVNVEISAIAFIGK
ncbi:MAG: Rid family detoxifying hydrolase [Chitinophagales bacterium]